MSRVLRFVSGSGSSPMGNSTCTLCCRGCEVLPPQNCVTDPCLLPILAKACLGLLRVNLMFRGAAQSGQALFSDTMPSLCPNTEARLRLRFVCCQKLVLGHYMGSLLFRNACRNLSRGFHRNTLEHRRVCRFSCYDIVSCICRPYRHLQHDSWQRCGRCIIALGELQHMGLRR